MTKDLSGRAAGTVRKFRYVQKEAARLSVFCYISIMSMSGALLLSLNERRLSSRKESSGTVVSMTEAMVDPPQQSVAGNNERLPDLSFRARSDVLKLLNR